jgi:thioredoxin reductase (NADPH)
MEEQREIYDVAIIGGGPAGLTAGIYCARSRLRTVVVDKNPLAGALSLASRVENYPGVSGALSGSELLSRIREQAQSFGAEIVRDEVIGVDFSQSVKKAFGTNQTYHEISVVIATGAMGRKPAIKGEADFVGKGVSYCATCDAPLFEDKDVVVAGRLELLLEDLPEVAKFVRHVYLVTSAARVPPECEEVLSNPKIEVITGGTVVEILGDAFVDSIRIRNKQGNEKLLQASGAFLYLQGRLPIVDFLGDSVNADQDKCIKVNHEDMSTSLEGVYAAGDVVCQKIRQSVVAVAEGCLAGLAAVSYVGRKRRK